MATLRSLATTTTGLYRDRHTRNGYLQHELLERIPAEQLARPVYLQRQDRGVYFVRLSGEETFRFELFSRRSEGRAPVPCEAG